MREHIDEVQHDDVQGELLQAIDPREETLPEACFVDLVVGEGVVLAIAL